MSQSRPVHITVQVIDGRIFASTSMPRPTLGRTLTNEESLALSLINTASGHGAIADYGSQDMPLVRFAERFLQPEDLGYAVGATVRDDAREVLGMQRCESFGSQAQKAVSA